MEPFEQKVDIEVEAIFKLAFEKEYRTKTK